VCLPGSGWRIESGVVASPEGTTLRVNRMLIANGDDRALVYYWFDQRGRDLTSEWSVKWYLFWDAVTMRRSDGAMVRLLTPLHRGESLESAERRLDGFVRLAGDPIRTYVPR
jgi:EpsI family protein